MFHTDCFVANIEEAAAILTHTAPFTQWPSAQFEQVGLIELAMLYKILANPENPLDVVREFEIVHATDENSPLILRMPQAFMLALAALDEQAIAANTISWTAQPGFPALSVDDAQAILQQLVELTREAILAEKPLLVFM